MTPLCRLIALTGLIDIRRGLSLDPCTYLATFDGLQHTINQTTTPFCNYADICVGINLGDSRVSCQEAYETVTWLTAREIAIPPILEFYPLDMEQNVIDEETEYLNSTTRENFTSTCPSLRELLYRLEDLADRFSDRLSALNYRYMYEESVDGPLLRNFTQLSEDIYDTSEYQPAYRKQVRNSESMRRLARYVSHMFYYLRSRPMHETEIFAASMAPWLHAFFYSLFQMDILYPDFFQSHGYALKILVRYHPLYTDHSTSEGVWYILMDSDYESNAISESVFDRNEDITWADVEDVFYSHHDDIPERNTTLLLEQLSRESVIYFSATTLDETRDSAMRIDRLTYALEYMSMSEDIDEVCHPELIDQIITIARGEHSLEWFVNPLTIESLLRIFNPCIPPFQRAQLLNPLYNHAYIPPTRNNDDKREIFFNYFNGTGLVRDQVLQSLLSGTSDDFFRKSIWGIRTDDPEFSNYHVRVIKEVMDMFLSPPEADTFGPEPDASLERPKMKYRNTQIALGRFLVLLLSLDAFHEIIDHYIEISSPTATLFETVFFNSRFVKEGFYHTYLRDDLEAKFATGREFVRAIREKRLEYVENDYTQEGEEYASEDAEDYESENGSEDMIEGSDFDDDS